MVDADLVHGWSFCAMSQYSIDVFNLLFVYDGKLLITVYELISKKGNFERKSWGEQNHHKNAVTVNDSKKQQSRNFFFFLQTNFVASSQILKKK